MSSAGGVIGEPFARPRRAATRARGALVLLVLWLAVLWLPASACAHGAADPEASDDLAAITRIPPGIRGRVVDGDLRLWLSVVPSTTVTVLDYQGAPFLRFDRRGVQVNENSPMYFLNLVPPLTPSIRLTGSMPPRWRPVSGGHTDRWHDGRLSALSQTLQPPGTRVLGHWTIPLLVDGRRTAIVGVLRRSPRPSLAWLWPPVAALVILPALLRLGDRTLERRVCRPVCALTILATATAAVGAGLHGRPGIAASLVAMMVAELAILGCTAVLLIRGRDGPLTPALIAIVGGYRSLVGLPVLWRGFVLLAIPPLAGRAAITLSLAGSITLAVLAIRTVDAQRLPRAEHRPVT